MQIKKIIILDIGSTCEIFYDEGILYNIHKTKKCTITSNKLQLVTNKKATLSNYGKVWFSPEAITNILSLVIVAEN